jgi:A/G-specific adenine glycosylase
MPQTSRARSRAQEASVSRYLIGVQPTIAAVTTATFEAQGAWADLHRRFPSRAHRLAEFLARFYLERGRHDLPWRQSVDPYEILVAELMLQKTHHRVVPDIWREFLRRWPRVDDLARARLNTTERVLKPLGLPRRAHQLKEMAAEVCRRGGFPDTRQELLTLPGVGPYTASAVLSQCFGLAVPMIDGNAARIYSRVYGFQPRTLRQALCFATCAAKEVIQFVDARTANLAMLDFAHAVCAMRPLCGACEMRQSCSTAVTRDSSEEDIRLITEQLFRPGRLVT